MRPSLFMPALMLAFCAPLAAAAAPESAPAAPDAVAVRAAIAQAICSVSVDNKWGIPVALSTGFLMGDGRFAITDLGAVAQPGVARTQLLFADGTRAEAETFGLADPALGLAALRIKSETPIRPGLALAPETPPFENIGAVTTVGWPWARQLDAVTGRLTRGPVLKDVAMRARVAAPTGTENFLRVDGTRLDAASGSPVVDASGSVLAVRLDVDARDLSLALAMPAAPFRKALLGASPVLKPLSELPKPLWPVQTLRVKGEPPTLAEFSRATQLIKESLICKACGGKGKVGKLFHSWHDDEGNCLTCQGEGIAVQDGLYPSLVTWAEQGTRAVWSPTIEDRTRLAVRGSALEVLKTLATSQPHFRRMFGLGLLAEILKQNVPLPRGLVFYARVCDIVDGPDGKYFILDGQNPPWDAGRGAAPGGRGPGADQRGPAGRLFRAPPPDARLGAAARTAPVKDPAAAAAKDLAAAVKDLAAAAQQQQGGAGLLAALRGEDVAALSRGPAGARRDPPKDMWIIVAGSVVSLFKGGDYSGLAVLPMEWLPAPLPPPKVPGRP